MGVEKNKGRNTLPERVAQLYYSHALFCSSHPILLISVAFLSFLFCCYPLLNIPLPGNTPTRVSLSCPQCAALEADIQSIESDGGDLPNLGSQLCSTLCVGVKNNSQDGIQHHHKPLLYVHRLILNIGVWPWSDELRAEDAFRAPLQEAFRLLDIIRNHQDPITGISLGDVCLHVEGVSVRKRWTSRSAESQEDVNGKTAKVNGEVLPEYNCLILSPANLWFQDIDKFSLDPDPLETIFTHQSLQKGKLSMADMVFGMHLKETGLKRYPLRSRTRILQYAVTIFYKKLNIRYTKSLNEKLLSRYPDSKPPQLTDLEATFIYYPAKFNYFEIVPLCVAFVGLFTYIYFSVRKIEFIKSKVGLALSAVVSIAAGLGMTVGICFFFGLTLSFKGKEIFPYLVMLVGVENVFILTKSVMSIDSQLDVKIRLAKGLSKEGWSITKNILTEITILTLCLFTFIPIIQQFSIFMIVSLLSDYFLQMLFFVTVLGIDIRRKELSREQPSTFQFYSLNKTTQQEFTKYHKKSYFDSTHGQNRGKTLPRSKSQPRLNGPYNMPPSYSSSSVVSRGLHHEQARSKMEPNTGTSPNKVPKRIRLVNVWARTRFFQRAFMIWMVVWVSMIIYSSGIVEDILIVPQRNDSSLKSVWSEQNGAATSSQVENSCNSTEECSMGNIRSGASLPPRHWASLLSHYNISCAGHNIAIAPPLLLRHRVPPDIAFAARPPLPLHPNPPHRWRAFAAALDPLDFSDTEKEDRGWIWKRTGGRVTNEEDQPFYPTSMMELFLLAMLCLISILVISYMMVVLYRCVCTRNYAEWRATWTPSANASSGPNQHVPQVVMEAIPIVVPGHSQEVECIATDGERVVSSCLQGTLKVWDPNTGDLLTSINRATFFELQNEVLCKLHSDTKDINGSQQDYYSFMKEANSDMSYSCFSEKEKESSPLLLGNFNFSNGSDSSPYNLTSISRKSKSIFDFTLQYRTMTNEPKKDNTAECESKSSSSSSGSDSRSSSARNSVSEKDNGTTAYAGHEPSVSMNGFTAIWCMDVCGYWDLIVVGCANGRLECWAASTGRLECVVDSPILSGITHVQVVGELIVLARLVGDLETFQVFTTASAPSPTSKAPANRGHMRTGSAGSIPLSHIHNRFSQQTDGRGENESSQQGSGCLQCMKMNSVRAHQQPLLALECDDKWIISGSLDHTVKVFWMDDLSVVHTLHGHHGPVRSLFLDNESLVCGSGSQEGLLCVWDLASGACVYSVSAHDGPVTALNVTASYVLSLGSDDRLCIWDRFRGHLLNVVSLGGGAGGCGLLSLGPSLVVSGGRGGLTLWDASCARALRKVHLGHNDGCVFVRQILPLSDGIVCDYSNQLRIVKFPSVTKFLADKPDKCE